MFDKVKTILGIHAYNDRRHELEMLRQQKLDLTKTHTSAKMELHRALAELSEAREHLNDK